MWAQGIWGIRLSVRKVFRDPAAHTHHNWNILKVIRGVNYSLKISMRTVLTSVYGGYKWVGGQDPPEAPCV